MSIAITEPSGNASGWMKYVTGGGKEGDRVAAYISDLGDPAATVAAIEAEMSSRRGRKHQGFRLVQSFSMNELDPEDPETPLRVNALGYELASRAAPNSPCVVITHMDSEGQNPHNHIYIVNHDYATGKAVAGAARTAFKLREVNDQLMRDRGMEVTEPGPRALNAMYAKQQQRGERVEPVATVDELTSGTWAEWTANKLDRCIQDERVTDLDSLIEVAGEAGISIKTKRSATDVKVGRPPSMTYALVDDDGNVRSKGRAKFACGQKKLGTDYSYEGLNATIDTLVKQRAEQARRPAQPVRPVEHQEFGRASQLMQQRMAAMGLGESAPVVEEVADQAPEPTPKRSAPAAEEPATAPEPVAPAPVVVEEPVTAQTGAQVRRHRQVTEDREPEPVGVDKELQDVLSQSSAEYVGAAVSTKLRGGGTLDDRVRARLRRQAERGELPEDRSTAYEDALQSLNPKAAVMVDRKVHRAWVATYGDLGTRPGQMTESQFRARRYDGPGSGRTSRLQQQMRTSVETSQGRSRGGRGLGD